MESRKMLLMNLFAGHHWRGGKREQTCGYSGGRRGWDELREKHGNMYITMCKTDSQWIFFKRYGTDIQWNINHP